MWRRWLSGKSIYNNLHDLSPVDKTFSRVFQPFLPVSRKGRESQQFTDYSQAYGLQFRGVSPGRALASCYDQYASLQE